MDVQDAKKVEWSYRNKKILAPMVRCGSLPLRRLAVEHGCDIVYSPEIIDRALIHCVRNVDKETGRISYVDPRKQNSKTKVIRPVLITYPGEPLVVQLGSANAQLALQAAKVVESDVCAIDINMGCPKHFSIQDNMGSALLLKPDLMTDILTTLISGLSVPVTCKIRLLDNVDETFELVRVAANAGVAAIAIHARRIPDRPRHAPLLEFVTDVIAKAHSHEETKHLPIIYNGDATLQEDFTRLTTQTNADSVMVARGALWNASLYRPLSHGPMLTVYDIVSRYIAISEELQNPFVNTKYTVNQMLQDHTHAMPEYQLFLRVKTYEDMKIQLETLRSMITVPYALAPRQSLKEKRPEHIPTKEYMATLVGGKNRSKKAHRKQLQKLSRKAAKQQQHTPNKKHKPNMSMSMPKSVVEHKDTS